MFSHKAQFAQLQAQLEECHETLLAQWAAIDSMYTMLSSRANRPLEGTMEQGIENLLTYTWDNPKGVVK